nr:immunoglobulin heavy chain junction region [Macaca mulatta]
CVNGGGIQYSLDTW